MTKQDTVDACDIFWIPDTLARHMGIRNKSKVELAEAPADRIYADDEELFMSVENNLSRHMHNDIVFALRRSSIDNSLADFSYNSNNEMKDIQNRVINEDQQNNNQEVQLSIPSLIFTDNNKVLQW